MNEFNPALPHGSIEQIFPDVYFVTGTHRGVFGGSEWQFSRNMTIVREGDSLTLVNSLRLDEAGLGELENLGNVVNVVRIGSLHGVDDAFYLDRYSATYWAMPGMEEGAVEGSPAIDKKLVTGGEIPLSGCSLFEFKTTNMPECILHLDREGGIAIACDALQNWKSADQYFSEESKNTMQEMGFFKPANVGPVWIQMNEPAGDDFARLKQLEFKHALCGHGEPLRNTAGEDYARTFERIFDI